MVPGSTGCFSWTQLVKVAPRAAKAASVAMSLSRIVPPRGPIDLKIVFIFRAESIVATEGGARQDLCE